ncbi:hypothetical protein MRS44_009373 [Fusarium solani]|uniref:uncharacterized protein n=1 Tax=Fusarium solani TaxID=169388 RepID=UPI0032C478ED|nr:hypothetical protein MRS44_009373 [Fusarium solani]
MREMHVAGLRWGREAPGLSDSLACFAPGEKGGLACLAAVAQLDRDVLKMPMHGWHVKSRLRVRNNTDQRINNSFKKNLHLTSIDTEWRTVDGKSLDPYSTNAARPGLALGAMRWRPPWRCRPAGISPGIDPFSPPLPRPFQGVEADERALIPLMPECLTKEPVSNLPQAASLGRRSYTLAEARRSLQTLLRTVRRIHFTLPAFDDGYYVLYSVPYTYHTR